MTAGRLPRLTARQLIAAIEKIGFVNTRQSKGGHRRFVHPDGRRTTVPYHSGKTIGPGLLRKILRDVDITPNEFRNLL